MELTETIATNQQWKLENLIVDSVTNNLRIN
jgi:hypothetical protein